MHRTDPNRGRAARALGFVMTLLVGTFFLIGCGSTEDPSGYDTSSGSGRYDTTSSNSSGGSYATDPGNANGDTGTYDTEPDTTDGNGDYDTTSGNGDTSTYDSSPGTTDGNGDYDTTSGNGDTGDYDTTPGNGGNGAYDSSPGTTNGNDDYDTTSGNGDTGTYDSSPGTTDGNGDYDTTSGNGDTGTYDTDPVASPIVDKWDLADDGWYEISNRETILVPLLVEIDQVGADRAARIARSAPYTSWAQLDRNSGIGAKTLIRLSKAELHISGDDGRAYIKNEYPRDYEEAFGGSDGEPDTGYDTLPGDDF